MRTMLAVVLVVSIAVGIPATAIRRIAVIIRAAEKEIEAEIKAQFSDRENLLKTKEKELSLLSNSSI